MEIKIKISDEQVKRLKDFGLGGIFEDAMKEMNRFGKNRSMVNFMSRPLIRKPRRIEERKPLNMREIKAIESFALKKLHLEVQELFETKKKRELFHLVLRRLSPHSLALLVK